jgi:uncharacterized membrane protein (UPF0127 family)
MIATDLQKTRQTRVLYVFSIIAIGALLLVLLLRSRVATHVVVPKGYDAVLSTQNLSIPVTIADTPEEQEVGLSYTSSLEQNTGKLFVFNTVGKYGFWMKDMNYSLDLVWIDKDFKIIAIDKNVTPESYPNIFYPPKEVQYVLEVNAGFSTANDLSVNQLMALTNNLSF